MSLIPERMVNGAETTATPSGEPAALQSKQQEDQARVLINSPGP